MTLNIGIVMDPVESIKPYKDSSLAMMLAAQKKGWSYTTFNKAAFISKTIPLKQTSSLLRYLMITSTGSN